MDEVDLTEQDVRELAYILNTKKESFVKDSPLYNFIEWIDATKGGITFTRSENNFLMED